MVKISIFCTFFRNPPKVFIRSSSKLGRMCRKKDTKNVLSHNFEFFTELIFLEGPNIEKIQKVKNALCFCYSNFYSFLSIANQSPIILFLQSEFKNIDFWPIEGKNIQFYKSFALLYQSYYNNNVKLYWYRILELAHDLGSTKRSKLAYYAHFREFVSRFVLDNHSNRLIYAK